MIHTADFHWNTTDEQRPEMADCEMITSHPHCKEDYVVIRIGRDLKLFCTMAQALQLRAAINDCPELREWEQAQRGDAVEPRERNAHVAEPFRGIVNAISEVR